MSKFVYADNAATSKMRSKVLESMIPFLSSSFGNPSSVYSVGREAKKIVEKARRAIANCINASPEEIVFTSCGSESNNFAIKSSREKYRSKNHMITSKIEHHSVLEPAGSLYDVDVSYLATDEFGLIDPDDLSVEIKDSTFLVSVMTANNEIGTIEPIKEFAKMCRKKGVLFHTDAVQAVGHIKIDVKELDVDMLSASAHKFNGPKGIGFLYIKQGTIIEPLSDGGAQEYGLRAGTENIASIVGMATALQKNCEEISTVQYYLKELEQIIISKLDAAHINYCRNGEDPHIPGNLSLSFKGFEGEMLLHRLDLMGIMVSTGSACDSKNTQLSHVLRAIRANEDYAVGTIRISLGKNNRRDDAEKIADALIKIVSMH